MPCTCGPAAPVVSKSDGSYCTQCGVQVESEPLMLYNNPLAVDMFKRKKGGVHWHVDPKRTPRKKSFDNAPAVACDGGPHQRSHVDAALRLIFTSKAYDAVLDTLKTKLADNARTRLGQQDRTAAAPARYASFMRVVRATQCDVPLAMLERISPKDRRYEALCTSLTTYYARHGRKLKIKGVRAYVAAMLTLLSNAEQHETLQKLVPHSVYLLHHFPPPHTMTGIGIPCRSVSRAVRAIKHYVLGPDFAGVAAHAFVLPPFFV